jgi:hypothetical protein
MRLDQIRQFSTIGGTNRLPSTTEDQKFLQWDNTSGVFVYTTITPGDINVQSDWNQTDNLQPDYIKNKPTIPTLLSQLSGTSDDVAEGLTNLYFTSIYKTKLDGIEAGAQVNVQSDWNAISGDAFILNKPTIPTSLADLTGTLDDIAAGTINKHFTSTYQSNVDLNTADRHTHTNKLVLDAITDAGSGKIVTDAERTLWNSYVPPTTEAMQDMISTFIQNGTGIFWTYDDPNNTFTPTVFLDDFTTDNLAEGISRLYYTDARSRLAISATQIDGLGTYSYDNTTGAFTFVGPTPAEIRGQISASGFPIAFNISTGIISWTGVDASTLFSDAPADGVAYIRKNNAWEASRHNNLSDLQLAGTGVTWGHIDDQIQTIAGAKTFSSGLNISTGQTYKINGTQIGSADLLDYANIMHLSGIETATGLKTFSGGLSATTASLTNLPDRVGTTGMVYIDSSGTLYKGDLTIPSSYYSYPSDANRKLISTLGIDELFKPNCINTEEGNVFLDTPTPITITAIDTVNNTVTLSYLPYIESIWNPTIGKEWIVGMGMGIDGQRSGQDQAYLRITGGNYSTLTLNYDITRYETNFIVGSTVYLYNIFNGSDYNMGQTTPLIPSASTTYDSQMNGPGPVFKHSDGTYRMILHGYNGTTWQSGVMSSTDLITWTPLFSGNPVFTAGSATWNTDGIVITTITTNPNGDGYIAYAYGIQNTRSYTNLIGWVKFDENFTNIEYSPTEVLDRTGTDSGFYEPNITFYKGEYRLMVANRTGNLDTDGWGIDEYIADSPEGPWILETRDVFDSTSLASTRPWYTNQYNYRSNHTTESCYFTYQDSLYCIIDGTARWNYSGNRGEREFGVTYYDENSVSFSGNSKWKDIAWGNSIGSYQFANTIWNRPEGHAGGSPNIYIEGSKLYFYFAVTQTSNSYQTVGTVIDLGSQINLADYYTKTESDGRYVPLTRTVAGKALSTDITLASSDLTDGSNLAKLDAANAFSTTQTINGNLDLTNSNGWRYIRNPSVSGGLRFGTGDASGVYTDLIEISAAGGYVKLNKNTTVTGNISTTGQYQVNGSQIASSNLSDGSSLVKFTSAQTITYSTTPTQNFNSGYNATITLTGNVTTYTLTNVPDGGQGDIVVIQNATGGYGISAFAASGLTVKYTNGTAPTSGNINSAANGVSVVSYHRVGTYLLITYGGF